MAAFRARLFHPTVLGLAGLILILYSIYTTTPQQFHYTDPGRNGEIEQKYIPNEHKNEYNKIFWNGSKEDSRVKLLSKDSVNNSKKSKEPEFNKGNFFSLKPVIEFHSLNTSVRVSTPSFKNLSTVPIIQNVSYGFINVNVNDNQNQSAIRVLHQSVPSSLTNIPKSNILHIKKKLQDTTERGIITHTIYEGGFKIENSNICPIFGNGLKLLILITSAPHHKEARMAIRQTWGHFNQRADVSISFFLGSTNNKDLDAELQNESNLYGDIIYARFFDTYSNLTLKTISMLEWVDRFCYNVKFMLKTDDDMFINVPKLLHFIDQHIKDKNSIFGRLARRWKPVREKSSKYYISTQQYLPSVFPDFTTGPAYLLTADIIHNLFLTSLKMTYLKLEDVYTTGIVAEELKIKRVHVNEFLNKRISLSPCSVQKAISIHKIKFHEQFDLWKKLLDGKTKC